MSFEAVHWTEWLSALGPAIIAAIVAFIAYRQWRLAQETLREKLFDRRLALFKDVHLITSELLQIGDPERTAVYRLQAAWQTSKFLFGPEISDYIQKLIDSVIELQSLEAEYEASSANGDFERIRQALASKKVWLFAQPSRMFEVFAPYLQFTMKQ
ncbi:hypothetical protein [Roseicyclus sp.]|uniref:hypothetical protein n=1 Tax=Roseicyclus sp. TaxID=1914329 RepID=UPI003FA0EC7B